MVPGKMGLLVGVMLLCFARSVHAAALGEDCSSGTGSACADLNAMVCDPTDETCRVKADGVQTDCASNNDLCPENAACGGTTCTCNAGFVAAATGLCTAVQDADCSSDACGDTTNYVCDPAAGDICKVKADGAKTDCSSTDANCATHATCAASGGTCSCNTGYIVLTTGLCTAVIGSTCENNAACSSVLTNSECVITYPCTKGVCACSSGYGGNDCLTLGYDKTCPTSGAEKCNTGIGLACDGGKCACSTSGETYRSEIGRCTDQKLLGETCTGSGTGDCYTTSNAACDTTCKCTSGYYADGQVCRLPYAGETCSTSCEKVPTGAPLISETSQQTPACTASKCDCGTHEQVSRKIGTTCYKVCLSQGGGTTAVGQTCAKFNDCESKVCAQCPDDANPKCYNAPCSGSTFSGSILVCSIILFSIFI